MSASQTAAVHLATVHVAAQTVTTQRRKSAVRMEGRVRRAMIVLAGVAVPLVRSRAEVLSAMIQPWRYVVTKITTRSAVRTQQVAALEDFVTTWRQRNVVQTEPVRMQTAAVARIAVGILHTARRMAFALLALFPQKRRP